MIHWFLSLGYILDSTLHLCTILRQRKTRMSQHALFIKESDACDDDPKLCAHPLCYKVVHFTKLSGDILEGSFFLYSTSVICVMCVTRLCILHFSRKEHAGIFLMIFMRNTHICLNNKHRHLSGENA